MVIPAWSRQAEFNRRLEWGPVGAAATEDGVVAVVVDVLRFSTTVEMTTARGAAVYPYRWGEPSASKFADSTGARLIAGSDPKGPSLSPASLREVGPKDAVVLPSPNGSTCAVLPREAGATVVAGCIRNAAAIGERFRARDLSIWVIPCGERWPDGSLRPALEDYLGAGAILSHLRGELSPEARASVAAWTDVKQDLERVLLACISGLELIERGEADDVKDAAMIDVSQNVPMIRDGAFRFEVSDGTQ